MKNIIQPTLLIDRKKVVSNIYKMKRKADDSGVIFRPHFKTHQNKEVGQLYRDEGISKITVSSVAMAEEFAHQGWEDITIAFPVNLRELNNINRLAQHIRIGVLVDSLFSTQFLNQQIQHHINVMVKIDVGYHRCGLVPENPEIDQVIDEIAASTQLNMGGFLAHAGHTYQARGHAEILDIMEASKRQLLELKHHYERFHPEFILSYGDTPSCSLAPHFHGFDEIRPGNFVYYDVMQFHLGSCSLNQIAVAVACPVVSVTPNENKMVIYGGGVHLSKEHIDANNGFKLFGYVVRLDENLRWGEPIAGAYVYSLSQEHGLIHMPEIDIRTFKPGDLIGVLPIHSCMTANLLKENTLIIN